MSTHSPSLPAGRRTAPLPQRVIALLVDGSVPALLAALNVAFSGSDQVSLIVSSIVFMLMVGWGCYVWYAGATRAATPGMRLVGIECVDAAKDGPIGWGRFFVRQLLFGVLAATVLGLGLMLTFLVLDPTRRGWHERASGSVMVARGRAAVPAYAMAQQAAAGWGQPAAIAQQGYAPAYAPQPQAQPQPAYAPQPTMGPGGAYAYAPVDEPEVPTWDGDEASLIDFARRGGTPAPRWQPPRIAPMPALTIESLPPTRSQLDQTLPPPGPDPEPAYAAPAEQPWNPTGLPPLQLPEPEMWAEATMAPPPAEVPTATRPAQQPASTAAPAPEPADEGEGTVLRPRAVPSAWQILLDDGRTLPLGAGVLLGRNPVAEPGDEAYGLIAIDDPTRTISKTHLVIGVDAAGPWMCDRESTNGSGHWLPNGDFVEAPAGQRVPLFDGALVGFGDLRLLVRLAR